MSIPKSIQRDDSGLQVPLKEAKKVPGYLKRKIREQKAGKKHPRRARARVNGAGVLTRRARKLLNLLNDDDLEAAVEVWREGLRATKRFWNPAAKQWIEEPDWRTRHDMSLAIAAYMEGKPVERQLQISGTFEDLGQLFSRVQSSPAARRALDATQASQPKIEEFANDGNDN